MSEKNGLFDKLWATDIFHFAGRDYFYNEFASDEKRYQVFALDDKYEGGIQKMLPYSDNKNNVLYVKASGDNKASVTKDRVVLVSARNDTVYSINANGEAKAFMAFGFGGRKRTVYDPVNIKMLGQLRKSSFLGIGNVSESGRYLFIRIGFWGDDVALVQDKKNDTYASYHQELPEIKSNYFSSDLNLDYITENRIVKAHKAFVLKSRFMPKGEVKIPDNMPRKYGKRLAEIVKTLKDSDNPVIGIYSLRK